VEEHPEDDEDDQYNSDGSIDFEEILRQEIKTEVKNKLENLESRVKIYFDEHNHACKQDFKQYEQHFKENLNKISHYMQELHDGHISEIGSFKREKDDQVIINNMMVKKVQKIEKLVTCQMPIND